MDRSQRHAAVLGGPKRRAALQPPSRDTNRLLAAISNILRLPCALKPPGDKGGRDNKAAGGGCRLWARKRRTNSTPVKEIGPTNLSVLHRSESPLVDIVFVHGLRGGSVKTWQKGGDARRFWPKLWLPAEPGFEHANIHAFGYDADWESEKGDIFKMHDFGRQLIEEMRTSPQFTDEEPRPVIMVGHSMGGLVIKKAFVIAQESEEWRDRMKSIFFLATPHRGSKYATFLNSLLTILRIAPSRQYIGDLSKDSPSLKVIHDEFIEAAGQVIIYSFYETLKMKIGISSAYVVEKESAVLGIPNERVKYAEATHCDISKYKTRSDSTYIAVRNSLALAVKEIREKAEAIREQQVTSQMAMVKAFLGVQEPPIERRDVLPGSCQWIQARDEFRQWQSSGKPAESNDKNTSNAKNIKVLWVYAGPGTGKSCLASYVQSHMEASSPGSTAYYYFRFGSHGSQSLAPFLRSMAYQMALARSDVREKMCAMHQDGSALDIDDSWTVWVKLFRKCILQSPSQKPFFCIIDALDECERYAELFHMLKGEETQFPLRIFITSRPTSDMERLAKLIAARSSTDCIEIPREATMTDMRSYIVHRVAEASLGSEPGTEALTDTILRKSSGCFLWARLVLDTLEQTHTVKGMLRVLNQLPEGMRALYRRSVETIEANEHEKFISKAILGWVVAGTRQLTLEELAEALQCDVSVTIKTTEQEISKLCGHLAVVKTDSNTVELIHPTAREFLLSDAGSVTISESKAHGRIALVCLQLLSGTELQPPRTQKALMVVRPRLSPLLCYAVESFSEHVLASLPQYDAEILAALVLFCKVNILGWIEKIAATGNCHGILRVSRNLTRYLDRRDPLLPQDSKTQIIRRWAMDLGRLVTKFGEPLLKQPSSIYFLIPPMCPANTAIAQVPKRRAGGLVLSGNTNAEWDDCVAHVDLGDEGASTVSTREGLVMIGTDFGTVSKFDQKTYQLETAFNHGSAVDLVHLGDGATVICTTKTIILQDTQGNTIWENRLRFRCLCIEMLGNNVIAVMSHGHLMKWDKATGQLRQDEKMEYRDHTPEAPHKFVQKRAPILAKISSEFKMVALGYNDGSICLWDAEDTEDIGCIRHGQGRVAKELIFSPNKNIQLLLVIYSDYSLATFDTWTTGLVQSHEAPAEAAFLSAACSPDGHTFATADGQGNITIWSFERLQIIGNIRTSSSVYRILSFTGDSLGILDVTDSSIKCWTPVLVAQPLLAGDKSVSEAVGPSRTASHSHRSDKEDTINVMATHPQLALAITGNPRGDVIGFAVEGTDPEKRSLYQHGASVLQIAVSKTGMVASYDSHGRIIMARYEAETGLVTRLNGAQGTKTEAHVRQLCFSSNDKFLLIAMDGLAAVYRCQDASCVGKWHSDDSESRTQFWMAHASGTVQDQFWLLEGRMLRRFKADGFPEAAEPSAMLLEYSLPPGCTERETVKARLSSDGPQILCLEVQFRAGMVESSTVVVFCLAKDDWGHAGETTRRISNILAPGSRHWQYLLGWNPDEAARIVLMDRDSWICSASLVELKRGECRRHFYVPRHLLALNVSPALLPTGEVVVPHGRELISMSGGFKFGYPATFHPVA